jgi:hypothetical protein
MVDYSDCCGLSMKRFQLGHYIGFLKMQILDIKQVNFTEMEEITEFGCFSGNLGETWVNRF